jgi:hypothetical protein
MSIIKLLQRVMSQDVSLDTPCKKKIEAAEQMAAKLHTCTYGITSDPLTQFAIVFAALIHDGKLCTLKDTRTQFVVASF